MGRYLLNRMLDHAASRKAFGAPIGDNQAVQWPIVETATELRAVRAFSEQFLAELDAMTSLERLDQPPEARRRMSMLKYYTENRLFDWADRAIQTHGGNGFTPEYQVFDLWRNLRLTKTAPVSNEMILNYLGEHELGLPRSY